MYNGTLIPSSTDVLTKTESTSYKKRALKTTPLIKEFRRGESRTEYYKLKSCSLFLLSKSVRILFLPACQVGGGAAWVRCYGYEPMGTPPAPPLRAFAPAIGSFLLHQLLLLQYFFILTWNVPFFSYFFLIHTTELRNLFTFSIFNFGVLLIGSATVESFAFLENLKNPPAYSFTKYLKAR